ncbi:MAG: aminopeptidase P family protein [Chloroflexi bacterium CG_4_9_14_3_um_filter_45_9]|nr:MAG: hypothetical protein AUK00_06045 [Dehalococcoidia bacterium CG2_30_46_9]PIU23114.1 MAG: aminopeptidase P family protein [Chloroflexi bacterium CG08_land_8_20_14_0_20_45_12]PIX27749.1 MAG: aminopeptidase P family protein [Chloroflexi bacterium CG_4_8_14_3_um_filter_45_15]PJB49517.1 MAG: aminopeptidase P family protein [Chloroflexi bacterium CG_4_9_14_3_um_filter_45_9]
MLTLNRLQKLRYTIDEHGLDALLVSQPYNYRYLSGFAGSSGWLLISESEAILATDFRYVEQAKEEAPRFRVIQIKGEMHNWLPQLVSDFGWHKLGFEANHITFTLYQKFSETVKNKLNLELIPTTALVERLRSIKESLELKLISRAAELTTAAFEYARSIIHAGMKEKEVAWEIEKFLRQNGSEGIPFEIIVASGPNSALPHARPGERMIQTGEPVLIDMGAKIDSYCSDFSRTLLMPAPEPSFRGSNLETDKTFSEIYNVVLAAQLSAIERIHSGMSAVQADQLARDVITKAGYGESFGHGLGHGVGLELHEAPTISPSSSDVFADGMVFTIEPGVYIAGWGGVRIEDMVVLEGGKARVVTKSKKDGGLL